MDFPKLSIDFDAATYKESKENVTDATDMEGGYVVTRPKFTRKSRKTISFTFREISDADKKTLEDFWESVQGGTQMFNFTNPAGTVYNVRFDPKKTLDFSFIGAGAGRYMSWQVDIVLVEV